MIDSQYIRHLVHLMRHLLFNNFEGRLSSAEAIGFYGVISQRNHWFAKACFIVLYKTIIFQVGVLGIWALVSGNVFCGGEVA